MNIQLIAVPDGSRLVADISIAERDGVAGYDLDKPAVIILTDDEDTPGSVKFTFAPYEPLGARDATVFLPMASIVHITKPQQPIEMGYSQATSRIVAPQQGPLIVP